MKSLFGLIVVLSMVLVACGYDAQAQQATSAEPEALPQPTATAVPKSAFKAKNEGLTCGTEAQALGNNDAGTNKISPQWDAQCIYLLDGVIDGQRGVGLVRGEEIGVASATFDASVWPVPAGWAGVSWAEDFAMDNCPDKLPISTYEGGSWTQVELFDRCP